MADNREEIVKRLSDDIAANVGNMKEEELDLISSSFDKTLANALKAFNSSTFDNDGFIKKLREMDVGDKDKDLVKNVLNNLSREYVDVQALNHSELLLRRDLYNICTQMPEMRDVVYIIRDSIIECNVATGEVSRNITFENNKEDEAFEAQIKDLEKKHDLLMAIKNFIIPRTVMIGEMYINVVPYSKLFAELEAIKDAKFAKYTSNTSKGDVSFKESVPNDIQKYFKESINLYNEDNLKKLTESVTTTTKIDVADSWKMETKKENSSIKSEFISKEYATTLLKNIDVCNGSSVIFNELGRDGFADFVLSEYKRDSKDLNKPNHFLEAINARSIFGQVDPDVINFKSYEDVKGCYIKYLDPLRMVPIRMDRKIIGYYYISTTMDLQTNAAQPNGILDLSFQNYTRDKNLVDRLAGIIIRSFDKKMLESNIKLKNEIAEIIMAHRFSEGRLSFIFVPENEVVRLRINEDEDGRGHSILEPVLFPARMFLMLTLYNMLYTLNNTTTRIHYLRSSGLNKDYAAQIQRTMRKFQSRRITIDDIYSYSGVLNKVGGMGEMVLPSGRGDYKALDTDTIEAVNIPINIEFLEQQRRQAISGTGVPALLVINAIDEVDFAKTLEMANTRFISTVSSYKIDFNRGLTQFYQLLMKYSTDIEDDVIQSFRFQFNPSRQQDLSITVDMINNFNQLVDMVATVYFTKDQLEDKEQKPTQLMIRLKKELAKEYLPQLDFDRLDEIVGKVNIDATGDQLQKRTNTTDITNDDLKAVQ